MPLPRYNSQVVAQGLARLTSAYVTQPNVRAWLAVLLQPWQDLEDATWQVLTMRYLGTATVYALPQTNVVFDSIGALVGQPRQGLSDSDYKSLIYLRVAVNRATGRTTDWARFATIMLRFSGGPVAYLDGYPNAAMPQPTPQSAGDASFYLAMYNLGLSPPLIAGILAAAVANGSRGTLVYTTWPFQADAKGAPGANGDLICGSVYDATAGNGSLGSTYTTAAGGLPATSIQMN